MYSHIAQIFLLYWVGYYSKNKRLIILETIIGILFEE